MLGVAVPVAATVTPAFAATTAPSGYRIVRAADVAAPPSILNSSG